MLKQSIFLIMTVLFLSACSGLGGEPEIVATLPPQVFAPPDTPDAARGAQIFAEHCTECHGIDGSGNGSLVQQGQVKNPGDFRELARNQTPAQWYEIITNGRIQNLMPPWADRLSEQERWDAALYAYTLGYSEEQLTLGEELFSACADCHDGQNPQASDLLDQERLVSLSDEAIYQKVKGGSGEDMHAFGGSFSEEELRAVVAYTRSLSVHEVRFTATQDPNAATLTPLPEETTLDITGEVVHGTAGVEVPADLTVEFHVFDLNLTPIDALTRTTTLDENKQFVFEDAVIRNDQIYLTSVSYAGRNFASGFVQGDTGLTELALPISIYELTTEPSVVKITAMVSQITVVGDTIEVQHVTRYVNTSDRVFVGTENLPDGRSSVLKIPLPPGAVVIAYDDDSRYYNPEDSSNTVIDTRPLSPGEDRFDQIIYILQYGGGAIIEYPTEYQIDGPVRVLLQPDTVMLTSDQFPKRGVEQLGNTPFQGYGRDENLTLAPGSLIRYELSGQALEAATQPTDNNNILATLMGVLGIALIAAAVVIYLASRRNSASTNDQAVDALVKQIADLDEQHNTGQINHDVYQRRRAELKAQLAALMEKK